jgi:UDP-N-acetylglucosamine diphosphorylase/glucosamine-1-phosphate N-acetyltransferase
LRAVVLAAGQGVRLWPLTENRPKPMIPIAGRPIISYVTESLRKNGVTDILVVVGYKKEVVQNYLEYGKRFNLHIEYVVQPKVAGTADAVKLAEDYVGNEPFIAVYGDQLISPKSVENVLSTHQASLHDIVMGVVPVNRPEHYGAVWVEGSNVKRIVEKPHAGDNAEGLVNAGLYVLNHEIFSAARKTRKSKRGEFELTDSLQSLVAQGVQIKAALLDAESWIDIGRPWNVLEANERILKLCQNDVQGTVEKGAEITPPVIIREGARVRSGAVLIGPVIVGERSEIGPYCRIRPFTTIGTDVKIGPNCDIKNSVLMDGCKVPHLSYVGDSVIGEKCNLGAGTNVANLRFDDATVETPIRGKMVDSERRKLGVILGDDVRTGVNSSLMPGVKVGSRTWIGAGVVLDGDVPSDTTVLLRQQLIKKRKKKERKASTSSRTIT